MACMKAFACAALLLVVHASAARAASRGAEELSLEQQAGQVFLPVLDEDRAASLKYLIRGGRLGGGLLRWDHFDAEGLRSFLAGLQKDARSSGIGLLIAADHEGGPYFTQRSFGATVFPGNMALGAAGSERLARAAALQSAHELRAAGIHIDFAPVADVNSDPRNPVIGLRSFGEDPEKVARLTAAAVKGYLRGGVLPAVKHFPGHGDSSVDSHSGLPVVDKPREEFERVELLPFRKAVRAGAPLIMTAHLSAPALGTGPLPATLSTAALQGVLRGELGFEGVIVSDSLDMGAISAGPEEAAIQAFLAGCDLLLTGKADPRPMMEAFLDALRSGRIPRKRLSESVGRILALKRRAGLLGREPAGPAAGADAGEGRALARKIAEDSVTLLRDREGRIPWAVPGSSSAAVVLFGPRSSAGQLGGFVSSLKSRHPDLRPVYLPPAPSKREALDALDEAGRADFLILGSYLRGRRVPAPQRALLRRLLRLGRPAILVSMGAPYDAVEYPDAGTVLLTYGPTEASLSAAARVIFGDIHPRGTLPVTLPAD